MSNRKKSRADKARGIVLVGILLGMLAAPGLAQVKCDIALERADRAHDDGRYDEAITFLENCLPNGIPTSQQQRAYELLALSFLTLDDEPRANEAVEKILKLNPQYEPERDRFPLRYIALVDKVNAARPVSFFNKMTRGSRKWFWVGGALATGVLVGIATQKENKVTPLAPDLPLPPALNDGGR